MAYVISGSSALDSFAAAPQIPLMSSIVRLRSHRRRESRPRWSVSRLVKGLRAAWQRVLASLATYFPPDEPQPSPPLAKAAALREGALLSESVDVRARKSVG
jgi:hypothetical protein